MTNNQPSMPTFTQPDTTNPHQYYEPNGAPKPLPTVSSGSTFADFQKSYQQAVTQGRVLDTSLQPQGNNYWTDPQRVVRYREYIRSQPPGTELPDWMNKDQIEQAYQYLKFRNNDASWLDWKPLAENDPGTSFLKSLPVPPAHLQPSWDNYDYTPPAGQPGSTQPFGNWNDLTPAEQLYLTFFSPQPGLPGRPDISRLPAAVGQGLLAGLGVGGVTSLVGTPLLGAIAGGAAGLGTAYEAYTGNKIPILGDVLNLLGVIPQTAEQVIGLVGEAGSEGLPTILQHLPQAWQAARLTYETQNQDLLNLYAQASNPIVQALGGQPMQIAGPNQVWQISRGMATPQALQGPRGEAALAELRARLVNGEDPLKLYAEYTQRFGDSATFNDFIGQMVINPDLLVSALGARGVGKIADLAGQERLATAVREGSGNLAIASLPPIVRGLAAHITKLPEPEGLITSLGKYRGWVQTGYFPEGQTRTPAAQLSDFEKWAGGLTPEGQIKELQPAAAAQGLVSWGQYLGSLTPAAKAEAFMGMAHDNLNVLFSLADSDPAKMVQILRQAAGIDPVAVGEVGAAVLGSPVTATVAQAFRDALKDNLDQEMLLRWTESGGKRQVLQQTADQLKTTPGELLDDLERDPNALAQRIAQAGGPLGTPEALQEAFGIFTGKDAFPWTPEQFQAQLSINVFDRMDKWLVDRYNITPDPGLFRLSQTLKGMQSLLLLGINPAYFVNNMVNNVATRGAVGVFGYMTPRQITNFLDRFGITPERLGEAIGQGGEPLTRSAVLNARRSSDWIGRLHAAVTATNNKLGLFSRFSNWGEHLESRNAYTIGMLKFWRQGWQPGKGMTRMPAAVEAMLDRQAPGVKDLIYQAAASGMNMKEVQDALFGASIRPQVAAVIDQAARQLFPDSPQNGAELLHSTGVQARLEQVLADATTPQQVNDGVSRVLREMNDVVNENHARQMVHQADDIAARVQAEGRPAVATAFADIQERIARVNATGDADAWRRTAEYTAQTLAGLVRGLDVTDPANNPYIRAIDRATRDFARFDKARRAIADRMGKTTGSARKEQSLRLDEQYRAYNERAARISTEFEQRLAKEQGAGTAPAPAAEGQPTPQPTPREAELSKLATQYGLVDANGQPSLRYLINVVNRNQAQGQKFTNYEDIPLDVAEQALQRHQAANFGAEAERQRTVVDAYNRIVQLSDQRAREAHITANGMLTRRLAREQFAAAFGAGDSETEAALHLMDLHADEVAKSAGLTPGEASRDAWYATRIADILQSDDPRAAFNQYYQEAQSGITNYRGSGGDPVDDALHRGLDLYHAGDLRGLDAIKWGIQQGINHLVDILGPKATGASVAFGKFGGSEEPTIYLKNDVTDAELPGYFYTISRIGDSSFNQWAVLFSRRAQPGAAFGPIEVNGLAGRVEPAIDINFDHPLTANEFAVIDRVTNELGIGGYTVAPNGSRIEIMRVGLYNSDYEPETYALQFQELARRLDSAGISGVPELYSREVWLSNKDTTDRGLGAYSYGDVSDWFEHNGRSQKELIDQRIAAHPYQTPEPPEDLQRILYGDLNKPAAVLYQQGSRFARMVQEIRDQGYVDLSRAREVFEGGTPAYLGGIIRFITEQRAKYDEGHMTARDIAKAYLITISSQGAAEQNLDTVLAGFKKAGVNFIRNGEPVDFSPYTVHVGIEDKIRPEDITGVWLTTDQGQRALDTLEQTGEISPEWLQFIQGRHVFGRFGNEPEAKAKPGTYYYGKPYGTWFVEKGARYKLGQSGEHLAGSKFNLADMQEFTNLFNEAKGDPAKIGALVRRLSGISEGKAGFVKHLLGFGDELTLDTQEANFWGQQVPEQYAQAFGWGNWARAREEIKGMITDAFAQLRKEGIGADVPETAFNHIMHHWLWDFQKKQENHHVGMYTGQKLGQAEKGGVYFIRDGRALVRAMNAPDVSTMVHEIGHIFRRDLPPEQVDVVARLGGLENGAELRNLERAFQRGEILPGDPEFTRYVQAEENFARGWERYLAEGDAPTPELRTVFQRFTDWMLRIYQRLRATVNSFGQRQVSGFEGVPDFAPTGATVNIRATANGMSLRDIFDRLISEGRQGENELLQATPPQPEPTGPAADLVNERLQNLPTAVQENIKQVAQQLLNELLPSQQVVNPDTHVRTWEGPEWYRQILERNGGGEGLKRKYVSALQSLAAGRDRANAEVTAELKQIILDRAMGQAGIESNIQPAILRHLGDNETLFRAYGDKILSSEQPQLEQMFGADWEKVLNEYMLWASDNNISPMNEPVDTEGLNILGQQAQPLPEAQPQPGEQPPAVGFGGGILKNRMRHDAGLFQAVPEGGTPAPQPMGDILDEAHVSQIAPLLEAIRSGYIDALSKQPLKLADLTPDAQTAIRDWLHTVESDMASTKYAAMRYGQQMRDGALLNYTRRYGVDNILDMLFPYQFWYTRSMINWAKRMVDRPNWFGAYMRFAQAQAQNSQNMPDRLKGKMRLPAPWLPQWAGGGLWFDPLSKIFPPAAFGQPLEQYSKNVTSAQTEAAKVIDGWVNDETVSQSEAQQATSTQSGPLWDKAMAQAQANLDLNTTPEGLVGLMFSPPLYWTAGQNLLNGTPEKISPLPLTRTAEAFQTALQGTPLSAVGNVIGGLAAPEKYIRKSAGLSEFGQWGDYYIDRELANMAADGTATADQVKQAMIERDGNPLYQQAYDRVRYEQMLNVPGAAFLQQALGGNIINALEALPTTIFGGTLFPDGELKLRGLSAQFKAAYQEKDKGNPNALNAFFADHPEYEARLALNQDPNTRLRQFLISEIWNRYTALDKPNRGIAADTLGQDFQDGFLSKETRNYDAIDTATLARYAQILGGAVPKTSETAQAIGNPEPLPNYYPADLTQKIVNYQQERAQKFPNYAAIQSAYYDIPSTNKAGRRAILARFPELPKYWDWNRQYKKDHPDMQQYWDDLSQAGATSTGALSAQQLQAIDPVLLKQVIAWKLAGQSLTSGAQAQLAKLAGGNVTGREYAQLIAESLLPQGK